MLRSRGAPDWMGAAQVITTCLMVGCALGAGLLMQPPVISTEFACPPDTRVGERSDTEGSERWCERFDAYAGRFVRHGPSAAWTVGGALTHHGAFVEGQMSGLWREWNEHGELRVEAQYNNGALHGSYRERRAGGGLIEARYASGHREGSWRVLDTHGVVVEHGTFRKGERVGAWVVSLEDGRQLRGHFQSNKPEGLCVISEAGVTRERGHFKQGKRTGVWSMFSERGILEAQGPLLDDSRHGAWTLFGSNGQKRAIGSYRQGARVGVWTEWVGDGTRAVGSYRGDHRSGHWQIVRGALSRPVAEGRYRRGKRHGRWRFYDESGALIHVARYRSGRLKRGQTAAFNTRELH